jgi:hypothetical protein
MSQTDVRQKERPTDPLAEAMEAVKSMLTETEIEDVLAWFWSAKVRNRLRQTMEAYGLPSLRDGTGHLWYSGDQESVFNALLAEHLRKGLRKDQISLRQMRAHVRYRISTCSGTNMDVAAVTSPPRALLFAGLNDS